MLVGTTDAVNALAAWGDSLTTAPGGDWVGRSATSMGTLNYNGGVSGETSTQIKARFDADAALATGSHRLWNVTIWMGRNEMHTWTDGVGDRSKPQLVLDRIAAMVATLGHGRYRIFQILPAGGTDRREILGTDLRNHLDWFNGQLTSLYGLRCVSLLAAMQAAGNGGGDDNLDIIQGLVPRSLMWDTIHFTDPEADTVVLNTFLASVANGTNWDARANQAPVVAAGADQSVALPAGITLTGSAVDDGLPYLSTLSYAWSKVSGPGTVTVTFGTGSAPTTTASFSVAGSYVLRLTVSDGALSGTDDVAVTVTGSGSSNFLLLESSGKLLLESSGYLLLET
jgi:hypothetical protein